MLTKMISFLLFVLFLIGLPILSMGQSQWNIPKLDGGILFDGLPDEEAWKSIIPFPFVTQQPNYSKEVESKTVVRMCFDDQYLYLGASMYVANSSMIRAIGKVRDFRSTASDWIGVQIDTYNDDQNAQVFLTNPNGICWDAAIFNDGTPIDGEPYNINWNTFWEVKTVIQDTIWHAEMKIPISSLRFESKNGSVVMGINVVRYQAANNQIYIFPDTPYKWGALSHIKPSTYADARFQGLKSKRPLYISPYLLVGASNDREISKQTTFREGTKLHIEPGLDIKYGINSHTTLDVTVNTDFSQVEADEQQFNLSRFSLVFPEKRKFFLERASVFDFGLGGPDQLFYSRRIGLHQGDPVRILGGMRLMNKHKGWDIGFMDIQTGKYLEVLPSENFSVFRVKKQILNQQSYTGGIVTSRIGMDGTYNLAYGYDAVLNLFGDEFLTVRWAQTFDDQNTDESSFLDKSRYLITWNRRRETGFTYNLLTTRSGVDFNPESGMEVFDNYYASRADLSYGIIPDSTSMLGLIAPSFTYFVMNDVTDLSLLTLFVKNNYLLMGKAGWNASVGFGYNVEQLNYKFQFSEDVFVPEGRYDFWNLLLHYSMSGSKAVRLSTNLSTGQFYDGLRMSPQVKLTWNPAENLELTANYMFDRLNFAERTMTLNNHIAGLRVLYMLNTRYSLTSFFQYNKASSRLISNLRFRYNPKEGTDFFLVLNDERNTNLFGGSMTDSANANLSLMLKYTYTFSL